MAPSSIGISYCLPVRLSVTVSVSRGIRPPTVVEFPVMGAAFLVGPEGRSRNPPPGSGGSGRVDRRRRRCGGTPGGPGELRLPAQPRRKIRPHVLALAERALGHLLVRADDVRGQEDEQIRLDAAVVVVAEQDAEYGDPAEV